jgi:hypothetical protein
VLTALFCAVNLCSAITVRCTFGGDTGQSGNYMLLLIPECYMHDFVLLLEVPITVLACLVP